jgi:transposase
LSEQRQRYNEEFKKQTVKYIQEQTKSMMDISEELDIPYGTLKQWMGKYRKFDHESAANIERVRELKLQLKEKDRQIADVEEELAIVKKAVHIFSSPRK